MTENNKPPRVYIAGPMTGYPALNFPAFHAAAAQLRALGLDVVSPAELNAAGSPSWTQAMRIDIAQLVTCDMVAVLPKWWESKGATLEKHIAGQLGMPVETLEKVLARHRPADPAIEAVLAIQLDLVDTVDGPVEAA